MEVGLLPASVPSATSPVHAHTHEAHNSALSEMSTARKKAAIRLDKSHRPDRWCEEILRSNSKIRG